MHINIRRVPCPIVNLLVAINSYHPWLMKLIHPCKIPNKSNKTGNFRLEQDRPVQTNKLKGPPPITCFHTTDACHGNVKHGRKDPHRGWKDAARRFHDTRQLGKDGTRFRGRRQKGAMHGRKQQLFSKCLGLRSIVIVYILVGFISGLFWFIVGPCWAQQMSLADPAWSL